MRALTTLVVDEEKYRSVPVELRREMYAKTVCEALWIALFNADLLGWTDLHGRLFDEVVKADERRRSLDT